MVVPNWLFDLIVFGALLAAALLDAFVPSLAGAAMLIAVCGATYLAAQELSDVLEYYGLWTQESVATATALSVLGFLYFGRNSSDLALLALSIVLMMASLMLAIAIIACIGAAMREGHLLPLLGLLATLGGAIVLGALAGLFTLSDQLIINIILLALGFSVWKLREKLVPPQHSFGGTRATRPAATASRRDGVETGHRVLIPQCGTMLDRFLPLLVLGAIVLIFSQKSTLNNLWPSQPASASSPAESGE